MPTTNPRPLYAAQGALQLSGPTAGQCATKLYSSPDRRESSFVATWFSELSEGEVVEIHGKPCAVTWASPPLEAAGSDQAREAA